MQLKRKCILLIILVVLTMLFATACNGDSQPKSNGTDDTNNNKKGSTVKVVPGKFTGQVVDSSGNPLENVAVYIDGTTTAGGLASYDTVTDSEGKYSFSELPDGNFRMHAILMREYNGYQWRFDMHSDTARRKDKKPSEGAVVNFTWKVSGVRDAQGDMNSPSNYYGGTIQLIGGDPDEYFDKEKSDLLFAGDTATLEIILTPQGPLADGTTGDTLVYKQEFGNGSLNENNDPKWFDIPIGTYTASAKLIEQDGSEVNLKLATYQVIGEDVTGGGPEYLESEFEDIAEISFAPGMYYYDTNIVNDFVLYLMK